MEANRHQNLVNQLMQAGFTEKEILEFKNGNLQALDEIKEQ
jgi:hypothetical protein